MKNQPLDSAQGKKTIPDSIGDKDQNHSVKRKTIIYKGFELLIVTLGFALCALSLSKAEAAEFSLGLYPPLLKIQAQPPAIINAPITIQNLSDDSVNLDVLIKLLRTKNENEDKVFFSKIQVLDKTTPIRDLNLAPQQKKDLFVKIDVDKNDPQKDYYFYIQFISKENKIDKDTSYSQILGGASLTVLMSVGKENPKATLEEFSSQAFIDRPLVPFVIKIKNTGQHFITPYGIISIKNVFGQTVSQIDIPLTNILKESEKLIKVPWSKSFILGLYTATLDLSISEEGPVFSRSLSFFVLPLRPILTAIILILVVILLFMRIKKRVPK